MSGQRVYFRVERVDLDGFPASPQSKISFSCSYCGKTSDKVEFVKTKKLQRLNLIWEFKTNPSQRQELIMTIYKSHMFKRDYVIAGLALDISLFPQNFVCRRTYEMEPVDGMAKPKVTCSIQVDTVGTSPFCAPEEPAPEAPPMQVEDAGLLENEPEVAESPQVIDGFEFD